MNSRGPITARGLRLCALISGTVDTYSRIQAKLGLHTLEEVLDAPSLTVKAEIHDLEPVVGEEDLNQAGRKDRQT